MDCDAILARIKADRKYSKDRMSKELILTDESEIPESWRKCCSFDFAADVATYMKAKEKGPKALARCHLAKVLNSSENILGYRLQILVKYMYEVTKYTWTTVEGCFQWEYLQHSVMLQCLVHL